MGKKIREFISKKGYHRVFLLSALFFLLVWLYPVHMNNIVLWMDTSEETEARVNMHLEWDDGDGYVAEHVTDNAIVSQEIFVRIPRTAKKNAKQYRLSFQGLENDMTVYAIKLNADAISIEEFMNWIKDTENVIASVKDGHLVLEVTGEEPMIEFNEQFTRAVRVQWHLATKTRLWLSLLGIIGMIWGLLYVRIGNE